MPCGDLPARVWSANSGRESFYQRIIGFLANTPGGVRTHNLRLRRPTRYPIVPRVHANKRSSFTETIVTDQDRLRQMTVGVALTRVRAVVQVEWRRCFGWSTKAMRISQTLVPVGPVRSKPPTWRRKPCESLRRMASCTSRPSSMIRR